MAGINSLSIRGIRSFGPDNGDEQKITFEKPLTLILGQNGCGKTTIIECLRYAITGQMPPGSRNECFVHDAKVNRSTEVMGQVKLKMENAKEDKLEVSRSMRVTALAKKTKFQTLDSFLSVIDENGKTKDISSRCADLDTVLHEQLGVSKAIINSVIFCHQEDSDWPLDEGKKVKERFDEIFDADKYSDCFDRLKKIRKEYEVTIKLLDQKVAHLQEKKTELDKKKLHMVNTETKMSEAEIKIGELTAELKPVEEKLQAIELLQKNLIACESKKEKYKTRLEHAKGQEEELRKVIKKIFDGTVDELKQNIVNYNAIANTKQKELTQSKGKIHTFNREEEKTVTDMSSNEVKFNKLTLLEGQQQEKIDKRNQLIVDAGKLAEIPIDPIENSGDTEKGITRIMEKITELKKQIKELETEADSEEKGLQLQVNECRDALSAHRQKILSKESEIQGVRKDMMKVERAISDATDSKQKLDILQEKLNTAESDYHAAESEMNSEEAQKQINDDEKLLEQYEQELEELSQKISKLQKQSAKLKERDLISESLKEKEKQFNYINNKHKLELTELLGEMPEKNFAVTVNKFEINVRKEVDALKKKIKDVQREVTTLEADRKHTRLSLKSSRDELISAEDKMREACGNLTYDAAVNKYSSLVEKLQEEQNLLRSTLFISRKYKQQLHENKCCPLCNRGFEGESDVTDLISDLTTKVMDVPSKLEKVTEELKIVSIKKDDLLSYRTLSDKINKLKETDIPEFEKSIAKLDKQLEEATESLDELNMSLVEPERRLQAAKHLAGDMPLLDRYTHEILATTKNLEVINSKCAEFECDISIDDATEKQTDLKQKKGALKTKLKANQAALNKHTKKLQTMGQKMNKLKEELLNVQKKAQEIVNLQEKLKELEENREKCAATLQKLQNGTAPLDAALKEKENIKSAAVSKHKAGIEDKRSFLRKIESAFDKIKTITKEIKQHLDKNIPNKMEVIKQDNIRLKDKKMQIMKDRDELTKRIEILKDELTKQDIYKRDLDDNLKLRNAQTEASSCEKEIANIDEKMSGMSIDTLSEKEPLIKRQTEILTERATIQGQYKSYKEVLTLIKQDLGRAENKNLEKEFREKFYEYHVTKALDKDIKDYSFAMEKCLMQFHKEKMENINLIIRELWRKIYRGNDIDYIEIKTDSAFTNESDRRKYDYKVVQSKNGVEIDMRGRCSAGQKVLACLIIRLALAETFSSRFGILALDEPTTNLDQDNIKSLCNTLGDIVQERMRQKNFMFIIITHDREFIESLGNIDKVTHFYEVSRNDDGKSRIKKIRFV